jgi:hypothetical protein
MDKVIVYLDDATDVAQRLVATANTHWVLVACAPRMTHRASKWVSHSARESWRSKWAEKLFAQVVPQLRAAGHEVTPVLARGPLPDLVRQLAAEHGPARIVDMRKPRPQPGEWAGAGRLLGMGAALLLVAE